MNLFTRKKPKKTLTAIIDIGSEQVSGALLRPADGEPLTDRLSDICKENLPPRDMSNLRDYLKTVGQALVNVSTKMSAGQIKPQTARIFLSSPYFMSQTKDIARQAKTGARLDAKDTVRQLMSDIEQSLIGRGNLYSEIIDDNTIILEKEIMRLTLDGYEQNELTGQMAESVGATVYISVGSKAVMKYFTDKIKLALPKIGFSFHTFSYAAYRAFREILPAKNFLLIDTAGEMTDIIAVSGGILAEHVSFPFAKNTILRSLARDTGGHEAEILSALTLHSSGEASPYLSKRLKPSMKKSLDSWFQDFKKALLKISETVFLPEKMLFIGNEPSDQIFSAYLSEQKTGDFTLSGNNLEIGYVQETIFEPKMKPMPEKNAFILIEALFCDILATINKFV